MKLTKIISMANRKTRLALLAMERSLRANGCELPLWVIPYDDQLFDLPPNARWWKQEEFYSWLTCRGPKGHAPHVMRKYQCLLESNYLFVDSDVVFLRNPVNALAAVDGFVTFCCHWTFSGHTVTDESTKLFEERSTSWQRWIFNSGQFASDRALYPNLRALQETASHPKHISTCLELPYHEQPGVNLLVLVSGVPVTNLTLPPWNLESSWAGHYPGDPGHYWRDETRKPFVLHWAGAKCRGERPVDELVLQYFSAAERREFLEANSKDVARPSRWATKLRGMWKVLCE